MEINRIMTRRFFDTDFAKIAGLGSQMNNVTKFVIEHRSSILAPEELSTIALSVRNILRTPIAEFYDRLLSLNQLGNFTAIFVPDKNVSIPEALTANSLTLDFGYTPNNNVIKSLSELNNKILINLTGVIKPDRAYGGFVVSSVDILENLIVRGQLTASYQDANGWLTPYIAEFVAKSYSMILSGIISRYHDLTLPETMQVSGILALFFCQLLSKDSDNDIFPPLFNRCTWVGNRSDLTRLSETCAKFSIGGFTLTTLAACIAETGPDRIKSFNESDLIAMCGNLGPDLITSRIALEFPPYWLFILLLGLSGQKIPLVFHLNQQKLGGEGRSKLLPQMLATANIFSLDRK